MSLPSSLLTPVKAFDVAAMKASQGPLSDGMATFSKKIRLAPESSDASQSIAEFKSRVTPATKSLYAQAQAGSLGRYPVESVDNAKDTAVHLVAGLKRYADAINRFGGGDLTPGGEYTPRVSEADLLNDTVKYLEMRNKDFVEEARLKLVIDAAFLKGTFGASGDVFSIEDGKVTINAFDLSYQGQTIARSFGGGSAASYRSDGTIEIDARI